MVESSYSPVPEVSPETRAPEDRQHIQADASMFGGQVAQSLEKLGAGATTAGKYFGQAAVDDQVNGLMDLSQKLRSGDPNKSTPGPDGSQVPDTGFLGKQGADALHAYKPTMDTLDAAIKDARGNLTTLEQQNLFDNHTRRLRSLWADEIGRHADQQSKTWMAGINDTGANHARNGIAANPTDPETFANNASDLINFRVKSAESRLGELSPQTKTQVIADAKREALSTQVQSIGVNDPERAQQILEKNRETAGTDYPALANHLRTRANEVTGRKAGLDELDKATSRQTGFANPALPIFTNATAAIPGGYSPAGLARTIHVESHGDPNAGIATGHQGLGQFSQRTWARFGQGSPLDPTQAVLATQRYAAANSPILANALGRAPNDAELYLAHQQGALGATALLTHPDQRAGDVLLQAGAYKTQLAADSAIRGNGGDPNAPASKFTSMWIAKFGGNGVPAVVPAGGQTMTLPSAVAGAPPSVAAPAQLVPASAPAPVPAAPASPAPVAGHLSTSPTSPPSPPQQSQSAKADAYSRIDELEAGGKLNYEQAQIARRTINERLTIEQIAADADAKARKERSDKAAGSFVTEMLTRGSTPDLVHRIAANPDLSWETKRTLGDAAQAHSGNDVEAAARSYGSGFWPAYQSLLLPLGDPKRISDPLTLLARAGPGGDLTLSGVQKLTSVLDATRRSVDGQSVHMALASQIKYGQSLTSYDQEMMFPGMPPLKDPKGAQVFNSQFLPQYLADYDQWMKAGKNPWDFLNDKKRVEELATRLRPPRELTAARMSAMGETTGNVPGSQLPPPPHGIADEKAWSAVVAKPPLTQNGQPISNAAWANLLNILVTNPTTETVRDFNNSQFGRAGYDGAVLIKQLTGKNPTDQAAPSAPRPAAPVQPASGPAPGAPIVPASTGSPAEPRPAASPPQPASQPAPRPVSPNPSPAEPRQVFSGGTTGMPESDTARMARIGSTAAGIVRDQDALRGMASPEGRERVAEASDHAQAVQRTHQIAALDRQESATREQIETAKRQEAKGSPGAAARRQNLQAILQRIGRDREGLK